MVHIMGGDISPPNFLGEKMQKVFIKPNGAEITVSESSYDAAISLGWVPKGDETKSEESETKRKGRPAKSKD